MVKIQYLDVILFILLLAATFITGFMTFSRIIYKEPYISYDGWLFAMCFGLTLQLYDYHIFGNVLHYNFKT
jgi:hypothetical protein